MRPPYTSLLFTLVCTLAVGCSDDDGDRPVSRPLDAGRAPLDAALGFGTDAAPSADGAVPIKATLTPNGSVADPGAGGLLLTASGESLAVTGYDFPPATPDDVFLVDGWVLKLTHQIVTVDHIRLWNQPDKLPADQSQHGELVAQLDGPWAIDLHVLGSLTGEGGEPERAEPFAAIAKQDNGAGFDLAQRYAFGFDTVAATAQAKNVNLDADALSAYTTMIARGYSVLYVGSVSRPGGDACSTVVAGYDFASLPRTLPFQLGFATPTSYVNCQNGSEFPGVRGINGEDNLRGVQTRSDRSVIAQVTVHADHPFWESFAEDSALRFDPIAAQYVGVSAPLATVEGMRGVDFNAFTDNTGKLLPLRTCVASTLYTPPYPVGQQLHFDALKVPVDRQTTDPGSALRDYADYMAYTQSTQGHLNSQGLCFVSRNFASPPGGS